MNLSNEKTSKTKSPAVPTPSQQVGFLDDATILAEIRQSYSFIHTQIKAQQESDEVEEIQKLLSEISEDLRKYEKEPKNKKPLDDALANTRRAQVKLNTITPPHGWRGLLSSMLFGVLVLLGISWVILRLIFSFAYSPGVFYLDAFVIAFVGSTSSAIIYLGRSALMRIDSIKTFCNLAASPFVAVILVIIFSELAIGVGGTIAPNGTEADIVSFTLKGASTELKYAFAFMFGFFGEMAIELLRSIMSSASGRE
jgi:hypothetical protein